MKRDREGRKGDRFVRISAENYELLNQLGRTDDTYNSVLSRIIQKAKEDEK